MIRTIEQRLVYENDYVRVFDDRVRFRDGHEGTYYYSRWKAPYGVGIVAVSAGSALLVRCYRYADQRLSLEIPKGFGTKGIAPEAQARSELAEETGLSAARFDPLLTVGSGYQTHIFLAHVRPGNPTSSGQEATEAIAGFEWMPLPELRARSLAARGVYDPVSMAALLAARDVLGDNDLLRKR